MITLRYILWTPGHLQSKGHIYQPKNIILFQTSKDEIRNDLSILTTSTVQTDKFWVTEDYTIFYHLTKLMSFLSYM